MPKFQIQKFRDATHAVEADESEERFDEALRKIAKSQPELAPKGEKQSQRLTADCPTTPDLKCGKYRASAVHTSGAKYLINKGSNCGWQNPAY